MKKLLVAFVVLASSPAFAGKMKEIYTMTQESVLDVLGFDESVVQFEGLEFVKVEGAELAVSTNVRMYYSMANAPAGFKCLTTFVKAGNFYDVEKTSCTVAK